jgi:hypothetical protein
MTRFMLRHNPHDNSGAIGLRAAFVEFSCIQNVTKSAVQTIIKSHLGYYRLFRSRISKNACPA